MAVLNFAMGQLNPVVYFVDSNGNIALPPSTEEAHKLRDRMRSRGYELREAGTLHEIDVLQKQMEEKEFAQARMELDRNERAVADKRKEIRERLMARMISSSTSQYERDFIKAWLMMRDDKRKEKADKFMCDISARFVQRDYDHPIQHLQEVADAIPDGKDVECTKCHRFRRVDNQPVCFRCMYGINDELPR